MIMQVCQLKDMPLPPSVNHLYVSNWKTKRRFKSKNYTIYERMIAHWRALNLNQVANGRDVAGGLNPGEILKVDVDFFFQRQEILTKKNTLKRNDPSNRLKALHDQLSELLGIDDTYFKSGSFATKIINAEHPGFCDITLSIIDLEGY
jgi:hypothetical protein